MYSFIEQYSIKVGKIDFENWNFASIDNEKLKSCYIINEIMNFEILNEVCSRLMDDLMKTKPETTLHCSQNGNFERLQCNEGSCYCADPATGQPLSTLVPSKLWDTLNCYNKTTMGSKYLRICDSRSNAYATIVKETQEHGSSPIALEAASCDPDGSYRPRQCRDNECHCNTKDDVIIPPYVTDRNSQQADNQNCFCARDKVIFNDLGRPLIYVCDGAGNYKSLQTIGATVVCVDFDGFPTSIAVPEAQRCQLACFQNQPECQETIFLKKFINS